MFNVEIHSFRLCVKRTFAWADKFARLLCFECKQQRHYGMKLVAYTLINLRPYCRAGIDWQCMRHNLAQWAEYLNAQ